MKQRSALAIPRTFFGVPQTPLAKARVVLLPIPYEGTVCYNRGASLAPGAILAASPQLERFDEELLHITNQVGIHTLPFLGAGDRSARTMSRVIEKAALPHLAKGKLLISLGGEHGVSIGLFRACKQVHGEDFSILQLDAHGDLRNRYQGSRYSHACVMRRAFDLGIPFVQVGVRSLSGSEWRFIQGHQLQSKVYWANHIVAEHHRGCRNWMEHIVSALAPKVYITLDVDCLDPSCMPATGTPEPGGLDYYALIQLLRLVGEKRQVIGADITELAPMADQPVWSFSAAKIVQKMIGYFAHPHKSYTFSGDKGEPCKGG